MGQSRTHPDYRDTRSHDLASSGMGGIGGFMANRAKGFDTHVIAVDAFRTDKPENVDELMPIDQLPDLMSRSDVVMIACPLTDETRGLINASNLALMKPHRLPDQCRSRTDC